MAFIVPNAGNTGGGSQPFANVNQAEPDSLDFEILGNRSSWIRSGGAVSTISQGSTNFWTVAIGAGVAVIQGVPYSFNAASVSIAPCSSESPSRFDAIVVRLSGTTATVTKVAGLESGTNPTLPQSRSTLGTSTFQSGYHIDFATDVVLHIVYRAGQTGLTSSNIVDKRVIDARPVTYASSTVPTNSTPGVVGDRRIVNGAAYTYVTSTPTGTQTNWLADGSEKVSTDTSTPVGSIVGWAGTSEPDVAYYAPCDGRSLSKTAYTALFNVLGYKYGGSGDSFLLPNINDERTIYGVATTSTAFGTSGGVLTLKLGEEHIPSHRHTLLTNGTDNTHNPHYHEFECAQIGYLSDSAKLAALGGGSRPVLATEGAGTTTTRRVNDNNLGLVHSPQMGYYGRTSDTQTAINMKGKHINLSWYIRVK